MNIYKGATPDLTFTFGDYNPTEADKIVLSLSTDGENPILEKDETELTVTADSISLYLTQEETLSFPKGIMYGQFNFVYDGGDRLPSEQFSFYWKPNMHNEVIE